MGYKDDNVAFCSFIFVGGPLDLHSHSPMRKSSSEIWSLTRLDVLQGQPSMTYNLYKVKLECPEIR